MRRLGAVGSVMLALLLSACVHYEVNERTIVSPRADDALASGIVEDGGWRIEALQLPADDDHLLRGARFSRPDSRMVVLYFGGNAGTLKRTHPALLATYAPLPVDVVAWDHRGYGGSAGAGGTPSMARLHADGLALYDDLRARMLAAGDTRPLIVHGLSMGSFVAGDIATHRTLDGLVLEASATTARDWVDTLMAQAPWYMRWFVRVRIDPGMAEQGNLRVMPQLDEPTLLLVGSRDRDTTPAMSRALYEAASLPPHRKALVVVEGAGHNDAAQSLEFREAFSRLFGLARE